jgi:hypothetical protein
MHTLSRIAAAASVVTVGLGGFALTAGQAGAAPTATFSPATNTSDCNGEALGTGTCTKATITASGFPANSPIVLIECPNTSVSDAAFCDNTTTSYSPPGQANYHTDASGNFSTNAFPAYAVPTAADNALGQDPGFICDDTHPCVLLVSSSPTLDITQPHAFTNTFTFAGPSPVTPEVPWAAVLPLGALALCGGSYLVLRTRSRTSASAA